MKVVIVGAGGHGRVVLDIFRSNHQFEVVGFLDTNSALHRQHVDGIEVIGDLGLVERFGELGIGGALIAIGDNRIRQMYASALEKSGVNLVCAIHPSSSIAENARVGKNVVIAAGASICAHTIIEDSVIVNTGSIVDHESLIGSGVHVCPGVRMAGHVVVKPLSFIGIGATVVQNVIIGESAVVGAGAVVLKDVPSYTTVVGVPAQVIKPSHVPIVDQTVSYGARSLAAAKSMVSRPVRRRPMAVSEPVLQR